ncbi:MAG: ribosome small subunit-dependent GTPase A [Clostridia bacterium]|nr:ribosome small subunit-dependent GTPase A [Clostridia bacterium]
MAGETLTGYTGRIMIGLCGYYDVLLDNGQTVQTVARGKFRKSRIKPLAGDRVTVIRTEEEQGVFGSIVTIEERKNAFVRPPVANIDRAAIVLSSSAPLADMLLADKLLIQCLKAEVEPFLVLTKCDEGDETFIREVTEEYSAFDVIATSSTAMTGIEEFRSRITGGITALAGQSGVGKSTLLNAAFPGFGLETGTLSRKVDRGRHTTRASQILALEEGRFVIDTPGFSLMDTQKMDPEELKYCYPEFEGLDDRCRFRNKCLHAGEPGCACTVPYENGRMVRYRMLLDEQREKWKKRFD